MSRLAVAVMAGGKSSRMGTDKSFVPLLGKPMIEHVLARVSALGQVETLLITNHPEEYEHLHLRMFADVIPDKGALGGIYTALYFSLSDYVLVVACDMPFLNPDLLRYMIGLIDEEGGPYDVIIPRVDGHPQGLHAIYRKTCLRPIDHQLAADRLKVVGFHDRVHVRYLDPDEYAALDPQGFSFQNINTPDELRAAGSLPSA